MNYTKHAMLVSLNIKNSGLLGQRKSEEATQLVTSHYEADSKQASAHKRLINPKAKSVKSVMAASQRVRQTLYKYSVGWGGENQRLITVKALDALQSDIRRDIQDLEAAWNDYKADYPRLVHEASQPAPIGLGALFDASQYPPADKIRDMFSISLNYWPMPSSDHFAAEISNAAAEETKKAIDAEIEERLVEASYDLVNRAKNVVEKLITKLKDLKVEDNKFVGKLHNSLIDNIRDTARIIEKLNLTNAPQINKVIADLDRLANFSVHYWRADAAYAMSDSAVGIPAALTTANEVMHNLEMLSVRDKEVAKMVEDTSDYDF
jgi:hypothetical protein